MFLCRSRLTVEWTCSSWYEKRRRTPWHGTSTRPHPADSHGCRRRICWPPRSSSHWTHRIAHFPRILCRNKCPTELRQQWRPPRRNPPIWSPPPSSYTHGWRTSGSQWSSPTKTHEIINSKGWVLTFSNTILNSTMPTVDSIWLISTMKLIPLRSF